MIAVGERTYHVHPSGALASRAPGGTAVFVLPQQKSVAEEKNMVFDPYPPHTLLFLVKLGPVEDTPASRVPETPVLLPL